MELREFALRVLSSTGLEEKLSAPRGRFTDALRASAYVPRSPGRPATLRIVPAKQARVPPIAGMSDPAQRVRILHSLANHELQAAELFAWALLVFPEAPSEFRAGLAAILIDEQRHTRMYRRRLNALGRELGDFAVSGYFWNRLRQVRTPLEFICGMSLTFENANLDHTTEYARAAREAGDAATARVIETIHLDESRHVQFGWQWLSRLGPAGSDAWSTYTRNLPAPLAPERARGRAFHRAGRIRAGLDAEFIRRLEETGAPCSTSRPLAAP